MALVLSLKQHADFYIGDERFVVEEVVSDNKYAVRRTLTGKLYTVTDARSVEVLPDVYLSAGDRPFPFVASVAIQAPSSIVILRGDRYRDNHKEELCSPTSQ